MGRKHAWIVLCVPILLLAVSAFGPRAYAVNLPTNLSISICGDGIVQSGEVCDQGYASNTGAYASSTATRVCLPDCQGYGPYCGDGILQVRFGEECDDGNNVSGDLCSATCQSETPTGANSGSTPHGSIPALSATPGTIPSALPTEVVLKGKAYPGANIDILLDGQKLGSTQADSNADFLYTSTNVTPGTDTFSFVATDNSGVQSLTDSATFDVSQSAVTTVSNIFIPPTISVSAPQFAPGDLMTLSGQSVPGASVVTQLSTSATSSLTAAADASGDWALQVDTASLADGYHAAKAYFQISTSTKSGFGRSVSFYIGTGKAPGQASPDLNGDGKINLVDFSIFLTMWNTSNARADFNKDGTVNLADFSIMLFNWTG